MSKITDAPNMNEKAPKQVPFWVFARKVADKLLFSGRFKCNTKIIKHGEIGSFKKEQALVISNHASMFDFANVDKVTAPECAQCVTSIEIFIGILFYFLRYFGNFPKRKFTMDMNILRSMRTIVNDYKKSVCLYPETRFSFAGVPEHFDEGIAKLAKFLDVRIVLVLQRGSYLSSPQWHKHPYHPVQSYCDVYEISKEEVRNTDAQELQKKLESMFTYNEYKWYNEHGPKSKNKMRADGIHQILYKCPVCGTEYEMDSKGTKIWCNHCHTEWEMADDYELVQKDGKSRFKLVPDWWLWEKEEAMNDHKKNPYRFEDDVVVEHLDNFKDGFVRKGIAHMIYDKDGMRLDGIMDNKEEFHFFKPCSEIPDIHLELNYKKQEEHAIDVTTNTDTWFVYPINKSKHVIKLNWMGRQLNLESKK